ncbi:MAG TPA: diacylglycerol kinase family protein [Candidatus Polarisedimenticolia bacterium]|nr:diacylglycerol kinase family protein [Candidatus Polarisedimenticolia bacterium]
MTERFFAVLNPAAGGRRCGKLAPAALDRVRGCGIKLEVVQTTRPGEAIELSRNAYARGFRNFLAVGGDGTSYEIVNGVFPEAQSAGRPTLGFLPLGTGNSFLRDFTTRGVEHTIEALRTGSRRLCDVIRLCHADGELYYINMLNVGFAADAGEMANRKFKRWGEAGYILGVLARLARLEYQTFPHRLDAGDWDRRPCLFLALGNSKFTGGSMMIAPGADPSDGRIEYVRCSPIGRLRVLWNFPRLFTGTYVNHPLASRASAERIEFDLREAVNVIVDGEVRRLKCRSVEILPSALDVIV